MCTATVTRKGVRALLRAFTSQSQTQSADLILMQSSWSWSRRRYSATDKHVPQLDLEENHIPTEGAVTPGVHGHEAHELSPPPRTPAVGTNSNILNRLRQLSVTEASNLDSHPDCGNNAQFDPELMKAVLARNRVKGGKSGGSFRNNRRTDDGDRFGDIPNDASSDRFLKMHNIRTRFSYRNPTANKRPRNTFDDEDDRYD